MLNKKKLLHSVFRTILGVLILAIGIAGTISLGNWQSFLPNNEVGFMLFFAIALVALSSVFYGIYLISPIFWLLISGYISYKKGDEPDKEQIEEFKRLTKKYIW